jgi:hypothetical protein
LLDKTAAVFNATQFKEMIRISLSTNEKRVMENTKGHLLGSSVNYDRPIVVK